MALLRSPLLVHLRYRIPQTVEICYTVENLKIFTHHHLVPSPVVGVVGLPSGNSIHKGLRLHAKHVKCLLAPGHCGVHC